MDIAIGFLADQNPGSRFFNKELAGGAAYDITVYAYEITSFIMGREPEQTQVSVVWGETGVDVTEQVALQYSQAQASLKTSIVAGIEEKMSVYGSEGKIVLPVPHHGNEAFLYDKNGELKEYFKDNVTENGFTYEIQEVIRCIREGKTESGVVPHRITLRCAELFDLIAGRAEDERNRKTL